MTLVGTTVEHIRVVGPLGQGGVGEVYIGFDEALRRQVALKALRGTDRLDADTKRRFLREARILSQLDHPNICRIHEFIESAGNDFLVLELIRGQTLRQAMKNGIEPPLRMKIARQVARALEAAHAKGVTHRDLKPDNVMLTSEGDVKVLDFGLARAVEDGERSQASYGMGKGTSPVETATFGGVGFGNIMGTVAYMSPEQARGEPLTLASDLYPFGLLLQELFTGQPATEQHLPFPTLLKKTALGVTLPITGLDPDLTSLINRLKALEPEARPTAAETAARLRWIQEKPRRRARQLGVVALLLALFLGGLKYTSDLRRERALAVVARNQAIASRGQAENLVSFMLDDLSEALAPVGKLGLLEQVAQQALQYYESVPEETLVGETLDQRGRAFYWVGKVFEGQGELLRAIDAYKRARAIHQHLVHQNAAHREWRSHLAATEHALGGAYRARGDLGASLTSLRRAQEIHRGLVAEDPGHGLWQHALASDLRAISHVLDLQGKVDEALELLHRSREIQQRLVETSPGNPEWAYGLAVNHNNIGDHLESVGDIQGALTEYEAAREISENLFRRDPTNTRWMFSLSQDQVAVAFALDAVGRSDAALDALQQASALSSRLADIDPTNVDWRFHGALSLSTIGELLAARGDLAGALAAYRKARAISQQLAAGDPSNADWQDSLAWDHLSVAETLEAQGELAGAYQALAAARDLSKRLVEQDESNTGWLERLAAVEGLLERVCKALASAGDADLECWQHGVPGGARSSAPHHR